MDHWYSIGGFSDPMSSLSHLVGLVVFSVFSVFLVRSARHNRARFWYSLQFAFSAILLLTMSFVYHMMSVGGTARAVMLRLDVAAIFVLIAGTFTAVHGILFHDWRRWGMILLIWTIAVSGITLRSIFFDSIPSVIGTGIFLAMGWIGAFSSWLVWKAYHWRAVAPMLLGGLLYTVGAVINSNKDLVLIDRVWGPHETFHLFVLAALGVHFAFIWSIADGSFQRGMNADERRQLRSLNSELPSQN